MDDIPAEEEAVVVEEVGAVLHAAPTVASMGEQSLLAAQQLGIIVGVALLVGGGFMLMVGVEMGVDWLCERISRMCGKAAPKDPEDPAALVGSFKRYK